MTHDVIHLMIHDMILHKDTWRYILWCSIPLDNTPHSDAPYRTSVHCVTWDDSVSTHSLHGSIMWCNTAQHCAIQYSTSFNLVQRMQQMQYSTVQHYRMWFSPSSLSMIHEDRIARLSREVYVTSTLYPLSISSRPQCSICASDHSKSS